MTGNAVKRSVKCGWIIPQFIIIPYAAVMFCAALSTSGTVESDKFTIIVYADDLKIGCFFHLECYGHHSERPASSSKCR